VAVREATATVLAHDKDINALAVAPNDALLASASQVRRLFPSIDLQPHFHATSLTRPSRRNCVAVCRTRR
jgi:hypothetical protein